MNHNAIYFKSQVRLTVIISIVLAVSLLAMLGCVFSDGMELWIFWICFVAIQCPFIIIFIYDFVKYNYYKNVNLKYIQEVKIEKTHSNGVSYASGLVVNLVINEEIKTFNTISIYSGYSKTKETLLDNVIGETVIAGLDEKNNVAVIIKKLENVSI